MNSKDTSTVIFDPNARYFKKTIGCDNIFNQINNFTQNYANVINELCEIIQNINDSKLRDFCSNYLNIPLKPGVQDIKEFELMAKYCNVKYTCTRNNTYVEIINVLNNMIGLFENWIMFEGTLIKCFNEYFKDLDVLEAQKFINSIRYKYKLNDFFQNIISNYACAYIMEKPTTDGTCVLKLKVTNNDLGLSRILSIDLYRNVWTLSQCAEVIKKSFNRPKLFL